MSPIQGAPYLRKYKNKDNALLVEFDFVVDIDIAIWRFIKNRFATSDLVDKDLIAIDDDNEIRYILLSRQPKNPLELLIPGQDTNKLYDELITDRKQFSGLLKYSEPYNTFGLMVTFLRAASSVAIDILCKDQIESDHIKSLNPILDTVINSDKKSINLNDYSAMYLKYYTNAIDYSAIAGKHIYIPMAQYNMQHNMNTMDLTMTALLAENNQIHLIDLYQDIKFRFTKPSTDLIEKEVDAQDAAEESNVYADKSDQE